MDGTICSMMNIIYSKEVINACKEAGYTLVKVPRINERMEIEGIAGPFDGVIDKGDFGIEPCIYLVGADAIEVAKKAIALHDILKPSMKRALREHH